MGEIEKKKFLIKIIFNLKMIEMVNLMYILSQFKKKNEDKVQGMLFFSQIPNLKKRCKVGLP